MKACDNEKCFWARTAKEILAEGIFPKLIALIKEKGVCDQVECNSFIAPKEEAQ